MEMIIPYIDKNALTTQLLAALIVSCLHAYHVP